MPNYGIICSLPFLISCLLYKVESSNMFDYAYLFFETFQICFQNVMLYGKNTLCTVVQSQAPLFHLR